MLKKFCVVALLMMTGVTWQACEYEVVPGPVDCNENPVALALVTVHDSNCVFTDGSIEVVASGGTGTYRYAISEGELQESAVFEGLAAGVYQVSAVDGNACSATLEAAVKNSNGMNVSFASTEAGGCSGSQGTVTVTAVEGTEPYQYRLGDGSFSSNHTFAGLSRGIYNLTVSDASGCEITQAIRVKSGISFSASIAPIIENNCAINDCHNGSQFPDFRVFKNIHDNASNIKALTGDHTMPQDGTLTQTQINMIACWVDDGAPDN
jgi:hypothetical protein